MVLQIKHHSFTVEDYYRMAETGILSEDDRVELIHGEIIEMSPIGPRHAAQVSRLNQLFTKSLGEKVIVRIQDPVHLNQNSEPQPDVVLVQPRSDFYTEAHPEPEDVLLIIEISDTTLDYDTNVKVPLYARAGIPEVWVWDVEGKAVSIYRKPVRGEYQERWQARRGVSFQLHAFPEFEITFSDLFG